MKLFTGLSIGCVLAIANGADINVKVGESINAALEKAMPGDTIILGDGVHKQDIQSVRDGEPDKYITITGSRDAVVNGEKQSRMIQINHSYMQLDGFTVDGKTGKGDKPEHYTDKCVYVLGTKKPEVIRDEKGEYESSLDGMILTNLHVKSCGGECVRLRSFITNAEVMGNVIEDCGIHDFVFPSKTVNGEAIYCGTSSNQWNDGKNSRSGPDLTKYIHIHHNEITPRANECCDVKEGSTKVLVEYNICSEQLDPNSGGLDSRTDDVIFRYNEVYSNLGAGVRIGGHKIDGHQYGENNEVYGNTFFDNKYSTVKTVTGTQHIMCENKCEGECDLAGTTSKSYNSIDGKCQTSGMIDINWVSSGKVQSTKKEETKTESSEEKEDAKNGPTVSIGEIKTTVVQKASKACNPLTVKKVKASDSDDNKPQFSVDGKITTRWSANKVGAWLEIELASVGNVDSIEMAFHKGDKRAQKFDVYGDGKSLLKKEESSGKTLGLQQFSFEKSVELKKLTIFGNGNSDNDWTSLTEIIVCGETSGESQDHDVSDSDDTCETKRLRIEDVRASGSDGNTAKNVLKDGKERWSCKDSPCELELELVEESDVVEFSMVVYNGKGRVQSFDLEVETKSGWSTVVRDGLSTKTNGLQSFDIDVAGVRKVKFIGYGCDVTEWNSLVNVQITGCK